MIEKLAEQFRALIAERDFILDFAGYNQRCYEIDDVLIPNLVKQIPSGMMDKFNQLVNSKG